MTKLRIFGLAAAAGCLGIIIAGSAPAIAASAAISAPPAVGAQAQTVDWRYDQWRRERHWREARRWDWRHHHRDAWQRHYPAYGYNYGYRSY